jgi:hypothetical protein
MKCLSVFIIVKKKKKEKAFARPYLSLLSQAVGRSMVLAGNSGPPIQQRGDGDVTCTHVTRHSRLILVEHPAVQGPRLLTLDSQLRTSTRMLSGEHVSLPPCPWYAGTRASEEGGRWSPGL